MNYACPRLCANTFPKRVFDPAYLERLRHVREQLLDLSLVADPTKKTRMDYLGDFFGSYPNFTYDPSAPATNEFRRLCQVQGWGQNSAQITDARSRFRDALIHQFNAAYSDDLDGWHAMMMHMGVDPLPDTISACKKIVKRLFVNLVDLVDVRGDPTKTVTLFPSEKALSKYTKRKGKFFPRDEAKAGGILKFLLRQIRRPRRG